MATFRLPARRLLLAGACSIALAAAPAAALLAGPGTSARSVADNCGGVNWNIMQEGAPITSSCGGGTGPSTGGAPSQQVLTNCSGIPGCLSNALYGPGTVQVPSRNTTVQQSQ